MTDTAASILLDQARLTIDRLRECWEWLGLLVEPGRETRGPGQVETDAVRELQWYRAMHERTYKVIALQNGRGALAPTPAGARVSVIDAQVVMHGLIWEVAQRLAAEQGAVFVGRNAGRYRSALDALDWLEEGSRPAPWVCSTSEVLRRAGELDQVRDAELAAWVDKHLAAALRLGLEACRVDGDLEQSIPGVVRELYAPIDGRCPACRHRSLQLVHDGAEENRRRWHVRCVSEGCWCQGQPCGCRQRVRYAGRRHAWAWGELTGPYGLWAAMAAAVPARRRPGSTATGHGGWSDRRTG